MGADRALSGTDLPDRVEVLHESERTRVTRLVFADGRSVVRKEPLGPDAGQRLSHERAILERLCDVPGVPRLLEAPRYPGSIVTADVGGVCLADVGKPFAVDEVVGLGLGLARVMAGVHRRGVVHRDISPANVVVSGEGVPCLVDFALASSFAELRPEFLHQSEIVGTLEYLAPEQTGRTGRPVDQRADLYALGATLYELVTGEPPFGRGDPLRLTHDHLARVPVPPAEVNRAVPASLSAIIMHLLEKEPDGRYQTADGLVRDLEWLREAGPGVAVRVGGRDFPLRLSPPSRLVGREGEVAVLEGAFEESLAGGCRGVLVGGAPGVGKTTLVDELRAVVTGRDGWFVAGKFDQYRRDLEFDAANQAFRGLGRLLLAEPEDELAEVRRRILRGVGPNAGLFAAVVPEFATLLGVPPEPGDPLTARARLQQAAVDVLHAVASRKRPVVVFVDDLQWAGRTPLGFVDMLLNEKAAEGLLLVGAYRESGVDATHPLAAPLSRWRDQPEVRHLRLTNLPAADAISMVAEMLHVDPATAADLAEAISPYTSGNPYATVELLNTLRSSGALRATDAGWRWDVAAVRAQLGRSEVAGLLAARVEDLPARSRRVVEAMACLGGRAELTVLRTVVGASAGVVEEALAPALDDGLLVIEPGMRQAVRFRHDRIREVILEGLDASRRRSFQLALARRLAAVPEWFAVAAEQYLPVVDAVDDPAERCRVVELLRRAAGQAVLTGDYALVNALLTAALRLIDPDRTTMLIQVHTRRHLALYSMGRLDDADEDYRAIEALCTTAAERIDATCVQVRSLTHRNRLAEALALGMRTLGECGITVPATDRFPAELDRQFGCLYRWLEHTEGGDEAVRGDITDPRLLAAAAVINALLPVSYFAADQAMLAWLSLEALRIWLEHGSARTLLGPAIHVGFSAVGLRGDHAAGYQAARRILTLGEAGGYEPDTSQARFLFAFLSCWFEPIENGVLAARQAREGLVAGGDLANAGYTYVPAVQHLLDCAPSLDACAAELEAGLAFMRRTRSEQMAQGLDTYRWLVGVLRGGGSDAAGKATPDRYAGNRVALFQAHVNHAVAAVIFGHLADLTRHSAAAMSLLIPGEYAAAVARVLRGLALAGQARNRHGDERGSLLSELDEVTEWLAARAADAPANFLHLLRLVEAERAWAAGDFRVAAVAFDAAQSEVAKRRRPWHQALITESAARFHLAHGIEHAGYSLLLQARRQYLEWGATAKVAQLDWAYPRLRPQRAATAGPSGDAVRERAAVTTGTFDLLGILSASQALSSETNVERLHARVVQVLSAMTGATAVHLPLWSDERKDWLLPAPGSGGAAQISGKGNERAIPMSVLRYARRTGAPLIVDDATRDDRFARDPYFSDVPFCSLLAVPILSRGTLRAVLLLENRLIRGAFTAERLDAVKLIAGQLAVSLHNVHLYAEFRRIADEQAALRRVATLVARGVAPAAMFAAVAEEIATLIGADDTMIVRFEPDGEATVMGGHGFWRSLSGTRGRLDLRSAMASVQEMGRAARHDLRDLRWAGEATSEGSRHAVAGPIVVEGRVWGAIGAGSRHEPLPPDTEQRLADFTELVATAIANAASRNELTSSRMRIVAAADQARRRIERDLHDGAQQHLVSLALRIRAAQAQVPPELGALAAELDDLAAETADALDQLREIARGIHPAILAKGDLAAALRSLARRSPIPVELHVHTENRLPEHVDVSVYYLIAEALTNAAKYAGASLITITVEADAAGIADAVLRVTVHDDGVGGADYSRGTGLVGLKDRVEALGGRIRLDSPPGEGTSLRAELPLTDANRDVTSP